MQVGVKIDDLLPSKLCRGGMPSGQHTLAHNSGKRRTRFIRTSPGDQIMIESSR
jgi:Translation initiation factor 1 (IF-1)